LFEENVAVLPGREFSQERALTFARWLLALDDLKDSI